MSNVKTNKFGGALLFILGEFAAADAEMIEDGGMEVFGEDDQGREGSCEVSINDLAQAASHEINHLTEQLAKANERVKELEFSLGRLRAEILHACVEGSSSSGGIKKSAAHNLHNQALMIPPYAEQLRKEQDQ